MEYGHFFYGHLLLECFLFKASCILHVLKSYEWAGGDVVGRGGGQSDISESLESKFPSQVLVLGLGLLVNNI